MSTEPRDSEKENQFSRTERQTDNLDIIQPEYFMIRNFLEWNMSRSDPRFKSFRKARLLYEAYLKEKHIQFDTLSTPQCTEALHDERLMRAGQLYRKTIELSRKTNALDDVATGLYQLGMLFHLQGRINDAQESFDHCMSILEALPMTVRYQQAILSGCHYHLGIIACRKSDIAEGQRHLKKSLEIDEANEDFHGKALCNSALEKCEEFAISCNNLNIDKNRGDSLVTPGSAGHEIPGRSIERPTPDLTIPAPEVSPSLLSHQTRSKRAQERFSETQEKVSFWRDVIWLLSDSTEANDRYMMILEKLERHVSSQLVVSRAAFGSQAPDTSTFQNLEPNERLCAGQTH